MCCKWIHNTNCTTSNFWLRCEKAKKQNLSGKTETVVARFLCSVFVAKSQHEGYVGKPRLEAGAVQDVAHTSSRSTIVAADDGGGQASTVVHGIKT